jgi:hypothetical protein
VGRKVLTVSVVVLILAVIVACVLYVAFVEHTSI